MRSPADMEIIQIDITNHCPRRCSNCTRFCGLHEKPYFMDFDTFKNAVDSLKGYGGVVGIMGGEPTLHPEFKRFMDYYREQVPELRPRTFVKSATASFREYVDRVKYQRGRHRGIWSSLGPGYYRHFEDIQDIFPYQVLNDHHQVNQHQGILIPRRELGVPDDEWIKLRDKCWIQNLWSASITPKGAFFCEIAASLDLLFDGPGGWKVEPGWWKRKPEDFADQLHWCEYCSLALPVPSIQANLQTELISEKMLEKLQKLNGYKIRNGKYRIVTAGDYRKGRSHDYSKTWFLPEGRESERCASTATSLYPQKLDLCASDGKGELATVSMEQFRKLEFPDFILIYPDEKILPENVVEKLKNAVFNPGFFYDFGNGVCLLNRRAAALKDTVEVSGVEELEKLYPRHKRSRLKFSTVGRLSFREKIQQLLAQLLHRGVFLLPEKFFRRPF